MSSYLPQGRDVKGRSTTNSRKRDLGLHCPPFHTSQPTFSGGAVPTSWRSQSQFPVRQTLTLPPLLAPLRHQPSHSYFHGWQLTSAESRLRRWETYNPLHLAPGRVTASAPHLAMSHFQRHPREVQRSSIGSMLELPQPHFLAQPRQWHYSIYDLEAANIECVFCKSNGEPPEVFRSHRVRSHGKVTCPILRKYKCRFCGATGDGAHTDSYCPENPNQGSSSMKSVLNTRLMSSGKVRGDSNLRKESSSQNPM